MQQKGNKRTITGWVFYDWANSVYPCLRVRVLQQLAQPSLVPFGT